MELTNKPGSGLIDRLNGAHSRVFSKISNDELKYIIDNIHDISDNIYNSRMREMKVYINHIFKNI